MPNTIKNLRNRPNASSYTEEQKQRGIGQLNSVNAYLRNDPVTYYYQKMSDNNQQYLRDDFWSEAAKRGESETLISLLQASNDDKVSKDAINAVTAYGDRLDYDTYMLALQLPHLDDTEKKDRIDEDKFDEDGNLISEGTGYNFGKYTDKEWAQEIINYTMGHWDAEIVEEDKKRRGWFADAGTQIVSALGNVVSGASQFLGDIVNLGEGLFKMLFDWSENSAFNQDFVNMSPDTIGQMLNERGAKFLEAFGNDRESALNVFANFSTWLNNATYEFQRQYASTVNAVTAYESGYRLGEGNFIEQVNNAVNSGAGYTTWGRWMNGGTTAIGYMLPTILLAIATAGTSAAGTAAGTAASGTATAVSTASKVASAIGKARSAIFYAGIFSGSVKETVTTAKMNGISYQDMNAGKVIANAAIKSVAQYAIEKCLGLVLGFSGVDKLLGVGQLSSRALSNAGVKAAQAASAGGLKAVSRVVIGGAKSALKEGLEETLQDLSDIAIDYVFSGEYRDKALENLTMQNLADSFIVGALTSVVMGSMANVKTFVGIDRAIGTDQTGQTFKLGAFETLNLREAMASMQEWNNIINDENKSLEKKASAMLSMNAALSTLGDVYKTMGTDRTIKADSMVKDMLALESKTDKIKALKSNVQYSNKLYNDFMETQRDASAKYLTEKTKSKIKQALEKVADKLKKNKVTELTDIITKDTNTKDPNINVSETAQTRFKNMLDKLGVEAIVGTDGNLVTKSEEIVFVGNDLLHNGDIETLVQGIAYDLTVDTVSTKLTPQQRKMIVESYNQITGLQGNLDDAVTALLFDKSFYTYVLLKSVERRYQSTAFEMLATIDRLIKARLTPNVKNGTITEKAYKALLDKVQKTMQTGLVTFATQYNMIDMGIVSNEVLPIELKKEIINHRNVRFTQMVNEGTKDKSHKVPEFDRIEAYNKAIDKYATILTVEEVAEAKRKAASKDYNDRVDAYAFLVLQTKRSTNIEDKVIYLPTNRSQETKMALDETAAAFGVDWQSLIKGSYNPNSLTETIKDFIMANGYDMNTKAGRFACIRDVLFRKSAGTLTLGSDGIVLKVVNKHDFVLDKYLAKDGQKQLRADIKSGEVKTLQDISNIKLDNKLGNLKLVYDANLVTNNINGVYNDGDDAILLSGNNILDTIMHEATHACQYITKSGIDSIQGGSVDWFNILPNKVQEELTNYIKGNFTLTYNTMKTPQMSKTNSADILYFMLAGELQANASLGSMMLEVGFTWSNDKSILVSPDGTKQWSMEPSKRKVSAAQKAAQGIVKETKDLKKTNQDIETKMRGLDINFHAEEVHNELYRQLRIITMHLHNQIISENSQDSKVGVISKNLFASIADFDSQKFVNSLDDFINFADKLESGPKYDMYYRYIDFFVFAGEHLGLDLSELDYDRQRTIGSNRHLDRTLSKLAKITEKSKERQAEKISTEEFVSQLRKRNKDLNRALKDEVLDDIYQNEKVKNATRNALLKDNAGRPVILYRGIDNKENDFYHISKSGGSYDDTWKLFEFYTDDFPSADYYKRSEGTIEAYISPYSAEESIVYNAKHKHWYKLGFLLTPEDRELQKEIIKDVMPFKSALADITFATKLNDAPAYIQSKLSDDQKPLWNNLLAKYITKYNLDELTAISILANFSNTAKLKEVYDDIDKAFEDNPDAIEKYIKNSEFGEIKNRLVNAKLIELLSDYGLTAEELIEKADRATYIEIGTKVDEFTDYIYDADYSEIAKLYEAILSPEEKYEIVKGDNEILAKTDDIACLALLKGYKQLIINNVNEESGIVDSIMDVILLRPAEPFKKVSLGLKDIKDVNWSKVYEDENTRYVSNKVAAQSNLKYWIRRGKPIQIDKRVAAFVSSTTKDFDKLPKHLRTQIEAGTLTLNSIKDYVATAVSMNEFTFKAIAKFIYQNPELEAIGYKGMRKLMSNIEPLTTIANMLSTRQDKSHIQIKQTPQEMLDLYEQINNRVDSDKELGKKYLKAKRAATTLKTYNDEGKIEYVDAHPNMRHANLVFFRHYDGTLESLRDINNIVRYITYKRRQTLKYIDNAGADEDYSDNNAGNFDGTTPKKSKSSSAIPPNNWIKRMKIADIDYGDDESLTETLDNIDNDGKIRAIKEYIVKAFGEEIAQLPISEEIKHLSEEEQMERLTEAGYYTKLYERFNEVDELSDEELNKRYLAILVNESATEEVHKTEEIVKPVEEERTAKTIKDHIRNAGRTITKRIAGLKKMYNMLPPSVQAVIDPKTYQLTKDYETMSNEQLEALLVDMKEASKNLNAVIRRSAQNKQDVEITQKRLEQATAKLAKSKKEVAELKTKMKEAKQNLKDKVDTVHKTKIVKQSFTFDSREEITSSAKQLLDTQWGKQKMSDVKGLTNNREQNVHNGEVFYKNNTAVFMNMTTSDAEATAKWFMDANLVGVAKDSNEAQTFEAISLYTLGFIYGQAKPGGLFEDLNKNTLTKIENYLKREATVSGTMLSIWNNLQGVLNPIEVMKNADMQIEGVLLTDDEKDELMNAAVSGDMARISKIQHEIIDRVNAEKTSKKSILRKITTVRSMSMLSSPITWLRNIVSNKLLKNLNKVATKIGGKIASKQTAKGQFKMDGKITPEIQEFISKNFLDNGLFDTLVSNLSRYNPSDIQHRYKNALGQASKDAIFVNMVIKSLYSQFYNQNMFNSKALNQVHKFLMKMLSDNNYVREAAVRYFGKILAERGYSLDKGVTDNIMNDFAAAVGLAMADYMHSDNIFNKIETLIAERSETGLFAYKLILPFASASWNWFKAAITYSPIGLGRSIFKLATLEKQIIKAENAWAQNKGQVSPELTEYLVRRELGSGIIGTLSLLFGMMLAGLGFVDLEEEDYGVPKLRIGNLRIDISTIFGSSSALAGMALVKGWQQGDFLEGLDAFLEPMLDGFFLIDILEMDKYNHGGLAELSVNFLEQTLLSFIPNGVRWLSGMTYTGKYKTNKLYEKAVARIPFLGSVFNLDKKVNPYTGDMGSGWDIFNRVVPFFEVRTTSILEDDTRALGINKNELRGSYVINGEAFTLDSNEVAEVNKLYGEWNAAALTAFYNNQTSHKVRTPDGSYKTLTYNQMTEAQRKNAIENLFSKHAEYAKIYAWLKAGNTYYASTDEYMALRKLGVKGNLYKGTRGFVKNN